MQSTGLTDERGREIFEGDIIRIPCSGPHAPHYTTTVEWRNDWACFVQETNCIFSSHKDCTVIGNIYQNPEILK